MSEEQDGNDLSQWLSTYGLITAERILERYNIRLRYEDLVRAIKNPHTFYHHIMRIPLKNIFNGIILQQARDYQVYAQKLFIDYLLSGESEKNPDTPGGAGREDLETQRKALVAMEEEFHQTEMNQETLIAESQKNLIQHVNSWQKILINTTENIEGVLLSHGVKKEKGLVNQAIIALIIQQNTTEPSTNLKNSDWMIIEQSLGRDVPTELRQIFVDEISKLRTLTYEVENSLSDFLNRISEMSVEVRQWRSTFYSLILRVNELIKMLPEYQLNHLQNQENLEAIHFDSKIGEKKKSE